MANIHNTFMCVLSNHVNLSSCMYLTAYELGSVTRFSIIPTGQDRPHSVLKLKLCNKYTRKLLSSMKDVQIFLSGHVNA